MNDSLQEIPGGWETRNVAVAGTPLRLTLPASPDAFLDDPTVRDANERDDYMPYWAYLWPAARITAEYLSKRVEIPPGTRVLELGCGVGLVGLGLLSRGAHVTFSDYDRLAVELAAHNARQNGFQVFETLRLDWRVPPVLRFPMIVGCDLLYELRNHEPLLELLRRMLSDGGCCRLGDPGRDVAGQFVSAAADANFEVTLFDADGCRNAGWRVGEFRMIALRKRV